MKLGVFMVLFGGRKLEDALDYVASKGLKMVEIGTGGNPGKAHCNPAELLENEAKLKEFKHAVESRGLTISALSCHGNPLHPQKHLAQADHEDFVNSVKLAEKLGVQVVNTFSGCPGDHENAKYPNWLRSLLGQTIFRKFWLGSGKTRSFRIGRNKRNLPPTIT